MEKIINILKEHEGSITHIILDSYEGFNIINSISNMRVGNCEDKDTAFDKGITIHTYKKVHQFNFSNTNILNVNYRKAFDETDNDTLEIEYKTGSHLTLWFEEQII